MRKNDGQIAVYSRKSKFTGKGESIGNQVELCREYVRNLYGDEAAQGCMVFEDEGFSGGNLKRPSFQKMLEGVRKKQFKAIVVYRLDRISRNISDFTGLIDELTKLDVSFVSIREQFDTSTPMGRAMMYIISVFSQLERETIAERIRDNMHELAKTGRWLGGNTPTGYESQSITNVTIDGKARKACHLTLIPEEGEIVKTIFDLYTQTDSLTAVETELLRRRVKTKRGNDFTRFSIKNILQNPVYMIADEDARNYLLEHEVYIFSEAEDFNGVRGMMVYNRTDQEKGKAAVILPMNEWIVAVGKHPGLIPGRQWVAVQNSLERNKSKSYRKPRNNEALLTGLLFCACGERMYPKLSKRVTASGELVYTYVCSLKERSHKERCDRRNANGNALDAAIIQHIKSLTEQDSLFLTQLERSRKFYTGSREQYEGQLMQLRAEFAEKEKKLLGLIDSMSVLEGSPVKARVVERMEQLSDANRQIENRIRELEGLTSERTMCDSEFDVLRQMLTMFRTNIDEMTVEEKRATIRTIVRKVIWDGENAHVVLFGADEKEIEYPDLSGAFAEPSEDTESPWGEDSK